MVWITTFITGYKVPLLLALVVLAFAAFFLLRRLLRKRGQRREIGRAAADRIRDEKLNHVILNSYEQKKKDKAYMPYDVDYGSGADVSQEENGARQLMVQLVERTELSARKFVLNPACGIRIGGDLEDNDIQVFSDAISAYRCEIFSADGKVYVRNLKSESRIIVRRRKEQVIVDDRGIRLLTGDRILLGGVSYDITITEEI